jgi:hypothetical protein
MFALPTDAPVDRLVKNLTAYIEQHPEDPKGYYTLARAHYLAFTNKAFEIGVLGDPNVSLPRLERGWRASGHGHRARWEHAGELALRDFGYESWADVPGSEKARLRDWVFEKTQDLKAQGWRPPGPTEEELNAHAAAALRNFKKAIGLEPKKALYHLGLASLLEQYAEFLREAHDVPTEFTGIILDRARGSYYTAYDLSVQKDLRLKHLPIEGLASLVSHEAGQGYIRLSAGALGTSPADKQRLATVTRNVKRLKSLRHNVITPIVFSVDEHAFGADLLAPDTTVPFDLDGDGVIETWPWVKPTTGILVWDPKRRGQITSGRQLFGSVTWWLFFTDGYRALDALDDSRDGRLTGSELAGISAWFDRNSNAHTEEGEVVTLEELDVASVATRPTSSDGDYLMNTKGLTFRDGRAIPTYDWVVSTATAPDQVTSP